MPNINYSSLSQITGGGTYLGLNAAENSSAFTAVNNTIYWCNTISGAFSVAPPASPTVGTRFQIIDSRGNFGANPVTVTTTTQLLNGLATDLVLTQTNASVTLIYTGATRGWIIDGDGEAPYIPEFGVSTSITNSQALTIGFSDVAGGSFTLPSAGTWEVTYVIFSGQNNAGSFNTFRIVDNSNNPVADSESMTTSSVANVNFAFENTQTVRIVTTGSAVYKLQAGSTNTGGLIFNNAYGGGSLGTNQYGRSKILWQKISGFSPIIGQQQDYLEGTGPFTNTNVATNDHAKFNTVMNSSGTSITLDTASAYTSGAGASLGRITLKAGSTYELVGRLGEVAFSSTTNSFVHYTWWNANTGTALGKAGSSSLGYNVYLGNGGNAVATITPTIDTRVELRITTQINLTQYSAALSSGAEMYFLVKKLGTTPIIAQTKIHISGGISAATLTDSTFTTATLSPTVQQGATLSGNVFTAPRAGNYLFTFSYTGSFAWSSTQVRYWISRVELTSPSQIYAGTLTHVPPSTSGYTGGSYSRVVPMVAGQSATLQVFQNSTSTGNIGGNGDTFSITEIV